MQLMRNQRGDTIVEVLISIGIVGLMLTAAYSITNRNTRALQEAQERGQAIKLTESQIELLRNADTPFKDVTNGKCMKADGTAATDTDDCHLTANGEKVTDESLPSFDVSITGGDPYAVVTTWESPMGTTANVTLYYRP